MRLSREEHAYRYLRDMLNIKTSQHIKYIKITILTANPHFCANLKVYSMSREFMIPVFDGLKRELAYGCDKSYETI